MSEMISSYDGATGELVVREMTAEELTELQALSEQSVPYEKRQERNRLLDISDLKMVPDAPWDTEAWAVYRQQLRDLPSDPAWPYVEFPDPPEAN